MHTIKWRNVATALPIGVDYLLRHGVEEKSRNGPVLVAPGPVTTVYTRPQECVLFSPVRDSNPFFTLIESIYMLAGRSDAEFLTHYIRDFGERFAEPDGDIHGGYGRRWRSHFGYDQLAVCIEKLRRDPRDRQAVIQMWDATASNKFHGGADDLRGNWRDRPCNLMINLRVRDRPPPVTDENSAAQELADVMGTNPVLDMMTTSRSHDILYGAYGANSVHFALLQQYLAAIIGVEVGTLTMISWNYHMYMTELRALARRAGAGGDFTVEEMRSLPLALLGDAYANREVAPALLVEDPVRFDRELATCIETLDRIHKADWDALCAMDSGEFIYHNPFLGETVLQVALCMRLWRLGRRQNALASTASIKAPDWRLACQGWFERRARKLEAVA